jgi:hypothetical protein
MDRDIFLRITSTIFIILTLITIIFALIIIVVIIYKWKNQSRSIINLLTCNSCATLLYHSIASIIQIPFLFTTRRTTTTPCKIYAFIYFSSCATIAYSYLIQAISRYFITILYKHKTLLTFRTCWILISINWMISGMLAAFMFISPLAYQHESESRMCLLTSKVFTSSFIGVIIAFCIPLTIISLLYTLILHHTTRNRINSNIFTKLRLKRNLKVFRNILLFTFILTIGGTPYFICVIVNHITKIPWPLYSLAILFISLSCTLESLALFYTNTQVKTLFYAVIHNQKQKDTHLMTMHNVRLIPRTNQINNMQLIQTIH